MQNQQFDQEQIKKNVETLIEKIKSEDTSPKDRLIALKVLNSMLEVNTEFIKELKKELDKETM